jgi:O-antigen ligase
LAWLLLLFLTATLCSQSAMDFFIVLLVCWFLQASVQRKNPTLVNVMKSGFVKIVLVWIVIVAIGYINSFNNAGFGSSEMNSNLVLKGLGEFKWILVLSTLIFVLDRLKDRIPLLLTQFSWSLIVASLFAIAIFFYGEDPLNHNPTEHKWGDFYRSGGFLQSPMTLAHLYVLYFSVLAGWFIEKFSGGKLQFKTLPYEEKLKLAGAVLTGLAVLLSFTRGVWLGAFAGFFISLLLVKPKVLGKFLFGTSMLLATVLAMFEPFRERLFYVFNSSGYDSERFWIWKANWEIVKEHFFIGVGYMHNKNLVADILLRLGAPSETLVSHAHNQYLHFLAGTGILGLIAYLALWVYFLRLNYHALKSSAISIAGDFDWQKGVLIGCLIAQITFLVGGLTESNFEHTKVRYGVFFIWALVWVISSSRKKIVTGAG